MAQGRKKATYIGTAGRDVGKVFIIEEMACSAAEAWFEELLFQMVAAGADAEAIGGGAAAVAKMGMQAIMGGVKFRDVKPLLDGLMTCVKLQPDPRNAMIVRPLINDGSEGEDIEEVETRVRLKMEVISLHLGFSIAGGESTSTSASAATN